MKKNNICMKLVEFIKNRDWVSFVEIEDFLEAQETGINLKSTYYYGIPFMNIAYWINMTEDFIDIIEELVESKKIFIYPSEWLVYLADGCCPTLPLVKKIPPKGYKELHWQPVCFRTVPHDLTPRKTVKTYKNQTISKRKHK